MLEFAIKLKSPVVIRYPKGSEGKNKIETKTEIQLGKSEKINDGQDLTIIAIGKMVDRAIEISKILKEQNINVDLINARFLKPLDEEAILNSVIKTKKVITIEDNIIKGGLGSSIEELIIENNLKEIKLKKFGYPDEFIQHGNIEELEKIYKLDTNSIIEEIKKL